MTNEVQLTALGFWSNSGAGPTTSFHLSTDGAGILLDVGIDPIGRLLASDLTPTGVTHVYISHLHSDHASGFANFVFTRALLGRSSENPIPKLTVLAHPQVLDDLKSLLDIQYPERKFDLDWTECSNETVMLGTELNVRLVETAHPVPCYGAVFETGQAKIAFTSDTAPVSSHEQHYADCDVLIGEAFGLARNVGDNIHQRGHSTAEDLGRLVGITRPRVVLPFHFGQEYADPEMRAELMTACSAVGVQTIDPVKSQRITVVQSRG